MSDDVPELPDGVSEQGIVHGQTGRVVGRVPWSWVKIAPCALVLAAVIGGGAVLMSAR